MLTVRSSFPLLWVMCVACGDPGICEGIEVGARYEVEVKEVFFNHPEFPGPFCSPEQDLSISGVGRFLVTGTDSSQVEQKGCIEALAVIDDVPGVSPGEADERMRGISRTATFMGAQRVSIGECGGEWLFGAATEGPGSPFVPYDQDEPTVFFHRCFYPDPIPECVPLVEAQIPPSQKWVMTEPFNECCDRFGVEVREVEDE